jgi:epoxide hydrolase
MNGEPKDNRRSGFTSRRGFFQSALLSGAGVLSADLVASVAYGDVDKATQVVLPRATQDITPFTIQVPQTALDDLKRRLGDTRWPNKETVADWSQGVPLQKAEALVAYWRDKYDWRRFEARINAFPQYRI